MYLSFFRMLIIVCVTYSQSKIPAAIHCKNKQFLFTTVHILDLITPSGGNINPKARNRPGFGKIAVDISIILF